MESNSINYAEAMQQGIKGIFPEILGIEFSHVTAEHVAATMLVRSDMCTLGGILHGGAMMAFADTLGAIGAFLNLPEGARTITIESKTNFLGAAPEGTRVFGEAKPIHTGKTTMVCQTHIVGETGKLLALVTQTQMVLRD
jgi:1,4-dihydroxy-2-naphthoyl-CoA hydrolase